jgi:hypothetical protein
MLGWPLWDICVTNDHGYVPLIVNTSRSFPHSWLFTGFATRLTRRVPLVEQNCLPFRSTCIHPWFLVGSCYSIFSFMCMFCRSLFVLLYFFFWSWCCLFFFDIQILITPLVYSNSSVIFKFKFVTLINNFTPLVSAISSYSNLFNKRQKIPKG